jgi:hypothetical protein
MELRALETREGTAWVVVDDKSSVWISCGSLWTVCGYSSSTSFFEALVNAEDVEGSLVKKRSDFPREALDTLPVRFDPWFARALMIAPSLAKRFAKYKEEAASLAAVLDSVLTYVASQFIDLRRETIVLKSALKTGGTSTRSNPLLECPPTRSFQNCLCVPREELEKFWTCQPANFCFPTSKNCSQTSGS